MIRRRNRRRRIPIRPRVLQQHRPLQHRSPTPSTATTSTATTPAQRRCRPATSSPATASGTPPTATTATTAAPATTARPTTKTATPTTKTPPPKTSASKPEAPAPAGHPAPPPQPRQHTPRARRLANDARARRAGRGARDRATVRSRHWCATSSAGTSASHRRRQCRRAERHADRLQPAGSAGDRRRQRTLPPSRAWRTRASCSPNGYARNAHSHPISSPMRSRGRETEASSASDRVLRWA